MMPRANPIPFAQIMENKKFKTKQLDKLADKRTAVMDTLDVEASNVHDAKLLNLKNEEYEDEMNAITNNKKLNTGEKYREIQLLGATAKKDDTLRAVGSHNIEYQKRLRALEEAKETMDADVYASQRQIIEERNKLGIGDRPSEGYGEFLAHKKASYAPNITTPEFNDDIKKFAAQMEANQHIVPNPKKPGTYLVTDKHPYYNSITRKELTTDEVYTMATDYVLGSPKYDKFFKAKDHGAEIGYRAYQTEKIQSENPDMTPAEVNAAVDKAVEDERAYNYGTIYDKDQYIDDKIKASVSLLDFTQDAVKFPAKHKPSAKGSGSGGKTPPAPLPQKVTRVNETSGVESIDKIYNTKEEVLQDMNGAKGRMNALQEDVDAIRDRTSTMSDGQQAGVLLKYSLAQSDYDNLAGIESSFIHNLSLTNPEMDNRVKTYLNAKENGLIDPNTMAIKPFGGKKYPYYDDDGNYVKDLSFSQVAEQTWGPTPYNEDSDLKKMLKDRSEGNKNADSMYEMYRDAIGAQMGRTEDNKLTDSELTWFLQSFGNIGYNQATGGSEMAILAEYSQSKNKITGGIPVPAATQKYYEEQMEGVRKDMDPDHIEHYENWGLGTPETGYLGLHTSEEDKVKMREAAIENGSTEDPDMIDFMQQMFLASWKETGGDMDDLLSSTLEASLESVTDEFNDYLENNEVNSGSAATMTYEIKELPDLGKSEATREYNFVRADYKDALDHVKANLANFTIIDSKGKEVDLKDIPNIDVTAITGVAMDDIGVQGQQMLPVKISADHKVMKKGNETVDKEQYTIYSTRKANASLYDGLHDYITKTQYIQDIDPTKPGDQPGSQSYFVDDAQSQGARKYVASLLKASNDIDYQFETVSNNLKFGSTGNNTSSSNFHFVNLNDPFGAKNHVNPHSVAAQLAPANHKITFTKTGNSGNTAWNFNGIQGSPLYSMYNNLLDVVGAANSDMKDDFVNTLDKLEPETVKAALESAEVMNDPELSNAMLGMWTLKLAQREFKRNNFKVSFDDMGKAKNYLKNVQKEYSNIDKYFRGIRDAETLLKAGNILKRFDKTGTSTSSHIPNPNNP